MNASHSANDTPPPVGHTHTPDTQSQLSSPRSNDQRTRESVTLTRTITKTRERIAAAEGDRDNMAEGEHPTRRSHNASYCTVTVERQLLCYSRVKSNRWVKLQRGQHLSGWLTPRKTTKILSKVSSKKKNQP